jgi:hypothetical protein
MSPSVCRQDVRFQRKADGRPLLRACEALEQGVEVALIEERNPNREHLYPMLV